MVIKMVQLESLDTVSYSHSLHPLKSGRPIHLRRYTPIVLACYTSVSRLRPCPNRCPRIIYLLHLRCIFVSVS